MKFLNKEISDAYYASPTPLEAQLRESTHYNAVLDKSRAYYISLEKQLTPQQMELVTEFGRALSEQSDMEGMFYFQSGWLAAKNI